MRQPRPEDARSTCANCEEPLQGVFCSSCGQKDLGTRVTLRELLAEVIAETFEIEGRLPRTLLSVAFRPGHYLGEFLAGRRRSFASPFRFYLLMLFVSAVVIGWRGNSWVSGINNLDLSMDGVDVHVGVQGVNIVPVWSPPPLYLPEVRFWDCRPDLDVLPFLPTCDQPEPINWIYSLVHHASEECPPAGEGTGQQFLELGYFLSQQTASKSAELLFKATLLQLPVLMSSLLIGYVLVLKVLWPRTETTVHVLTSMVFHTLGLVAVTLFALYPAWWFLLLLGIWHQAHVMFGLKQAFQSGWVRTLVSYVLSGAVWSAMAVVAMGAAWFLGFRELAQVYVPS